MKENTMCFSWIEAKTGTTVERINVCHVDAVYYNGTSYVNVWYIDHENHDQLEFKRFEMDAEHWFMVL